MAQHETLVGRIDRHADDALDDIEGARRELRQVYDYQSGNRALILKVFFILLVFVTFYIIFIL